MGKKHLIAVDIDGTMGKKYHPNVFIRNVLQMDPDEFWARVIEAEKQFPDTDHFVTFPTMLLHIYREKFGKMPSRGEFLEVGQELDQDYFYPGAENFFPELKEDHNERKFYVGCITQGIVPMIEGSRFGQTLDFRLGYDFITVDGSSDGEIIGVGQNCSEFNKGALLSRLSIGQSETPKVFDWPLKDAFYLMDGVTDKSFGRVGYQYGAYGIIIVEQNVEGIVPVASMQVAEDLIKGKYGHKIAHNNFHRGGDVRNTIDLRLSKL